MVSDSEIQKFSEQIVRDYQPQRVILFGSHAYGTPHEYSDVDLLVIMPYEGNSLRKAAEIIRALNPRFGVDLLIRTQQELSQRLEWRDSFMQEIIDKGRVLYAAANS